MAKARPDTPDDNTPSFEDSIEQVEAIIERIERGEQGLERSIADYERGAGLLKKCREILTRSEQRIAQIEADLSASVQPPALQRSQPLKRSNAAEPMPSTPPPARADDEGDTPF